MLRRHPALYYIRYLLLSKNCRDTAALESFGDVNGITDIPPVFTQVNLQMGIDPNAADFDKAKTIAAFLRKNTKIGPGLSLTAEATLNGMLYGNGGICSDFALVFNAFCLLNKIASREWNCVDRLYQTQYGHAFNEIYDVKKQAWIAIDSHKGIYFVGEDQETPLSTLALFTFLRTGNSLQYRNISDYETHKPERLPLVYSKNTIPFLVANYKLNDIDPILERYKKLPMFAVMSLLIARRKNYYFLFVMDNYKQKLFPWIYQKQPGSR